MSNLHSDINVVPSDLYVTTTVAQAPIGARAVTSDGREFRYVKVGGTALVAGNLQQSSAQVANLLNVAASTAAIGDTSITLTISSTAITANSLNGAIVVFNAGTGIGQSYRIKSHTSGTITSLVLTLEDPIAVATLSSDTKASVYLNKYQGVVVNPTTPTGSPVGVAIVANTASGFGWIQAKGLVSCLNDSATTIGLALAPSQSVAGALKTGATTLDSVARACQAGVNAEYRIVDLYGV